MERETFFRISSDRVAMETRAHIPHVVRLSLLNWLGYRERGGPEMVPVWTERLLASGVRNACFHEGWEVTYRRADGGWTKLLDPDWPEVRALSKAYLAWRLSPEAPKADGELE